MYGLRATEVVGYTADADIYCPACAALVYDRTVDGVLRTVADPREAFQALDFEDNVVHPIFGSDDLDAGHNECARCQGELVEMDDCPNGYGCGAAHQSWQDCP
jgi:hypothetical protein